MRLRHIQVLVAVSESGSLRAAARKLGLSQPALSKSVRQMESDFHVPMLTRTPRGVVLTEYGRAVLVRARSIDAELRKMQEEVGQLSGRMRGSVSIGVAPLPSLMILPQVLPRFCTKYPEVVVRVVDGIYPTVLPLIREGVLDFTIGPGPPDRISGEFEVEELLETKLVVVGRVGHPNAKARQLADLAGAQWMTLGPAGGPGDYFVNAFLSEGLKAPEAMVKSESFASSMALLEASDMLSILPQRLINLPRMRDRLRALSLSVQLPSVKVLLLRRPGVPLTPAAEALATYIRRRANAIGRGDRQDSSGSDERY